MPPLIIHNTPVPAQAMHFKKPALSTPSLLMSVSILLSFSMIVCFRFRTQTSYATEFCGNYLQHPPLSLDYTGVDQGITRPHVIKVRERFMLLILISA